MAYIRSHSQYTVPDFVTNNLRKWENNNMYLSSYDKLSATNVYNLITIRPQQLRTLLCNS